MSVVHKLGKVVAEQKRKNHTVITCISASGFVLPPCLIYPRKRAIPGKFRDGAVPVTLFKNTKNGWINQQVWFQ